LFYHAAKMLYKIDISTIFSANGRNMMMSGFYLSLKSKVLSSKSDTEFIFPYSGLKTFDSLLSGKNKINL